MVTTDGEPAARDGETATCGSEVMLLDITVLMGGPSAEREVSLLSGEAVASALERVGHRVTRADISPRDTSALDREGVDVVFIALHGEFGESGGVQALCEERGLKYTGSRARASGLAIDKAAAKQICKRAGLVTPDWMILEDFHPPEQTAAWLAELPPPVVVKPVDGGSSVDVIIARDAAQRDGAIEDLLDKYARVLVEQFVAGREITVGILGDQALPVLEILPAEEFYDYHAKYADDAGTKYTFDLGLDEEVLRAVQRDALTAHTALDCRHMSRVDFLLDASGEAHFLEVNTIPGFTSHSLLPMAAKRVGIDFEQLVHRIAIMAHQA